MDESEIRRRGANCKDLLKVVRKIEKTTDHTLDKVKMNYSRLRRVIGLDVPRPETPKGFLRRGVYVVTSDVISVPSSAVLSFSRPYLKKNDTEDAIDYLLMKALPNMNKPVEERGVERIDYTLDADFKDKRIIYYHCNCGLIKDWKQISGIFQANDWTLYDPSSFERIGAQIMPGKIEDE